MQFKFKKSTKPAEVPRLGWTIFIGLIGLQGFIGAFDSVFNETLTDRLGRAVGIGFSLWAILRVTQMKNFEYKLRLFSLGKIINQLKLKSYFIQF